MELLLIVGGILLLLFLYGVISVIRQELETGKRAEANLRIAKTNIEELTEEIDSYQVKYQELKDLHELTVEKNDLLFRQLQSENLELKETFEKTIRQKDYLFEQLKNKNEDSLEYISSLIADHLTLQYDISANFLLIKRHPASKEAKRIKQLKEETKDIIQSNKLIQYKYDLLFQIFPDLEFYVDDVESISELNDLKNLSELKVFNDNTRNYLSKEEYQSLSEDVRNQLALDRYIKSTKTKWQIGRDYELFVGYTYMREGWDVEFYGIDKQLEDMGRDLIAAKGNDIHIIQCKYWAKSKLIHEKHIAQLYGSTVQFILSTGTDKNVTPILITNTHLSDTAKMFAEYLKVVFIQDKSISEFPRIKCNTGKDEYGRTTKIYHLPMDQQYDRTKLSNKGDFFAFTVKEAVDDGFRRAHRWYGN